ncbi:MAG: glycosyl hydrolase family 65 protein [bacterium]
MKEPFEQYLAEPRWLISENGWDKNKQNAQETRFTIGNGYLGLRGIYEEIPEGSQPGTYITGVYDAVSSQVTELVNTPNPIDFRINYGGEKLDLTAMDVVSHCRVLDLSKGLLARKTIFQSAQKLRFNYQSLRMVSMQQKHIGVMQIFFTPLDARARITVQCAVNEAVTNKGMVTEGQKKHFHINEFKKFGSINFLSVKTFETDILVSVASELKLYKNFKNRTVPHRSTTLTVDKGETVVFTKYFSIHTSRHIGTKAITKRVVGTLRKAVAQGFDRLLKESYRAWKKKWSLCDISIKGDHEVDRAVRFNLYHMLIAAHDDRGFSSVGAKTLSGEGYRGHIFWDTEIFILPFYIYTLPQIARSLLMYRYYRLDHARRIAQERGYKGALFPWESADAGSECTPEWHKDLDGTVIQIFTMLREHHISADIAYGVYMYYRLTRDNDFLINYGVEIIFETARFWASRIELNPRTKKYDIRHVIGPDEFHEDVNNNAYTNVMAQWNIMAAVLLVKKLKKLMPGKMQKIMRRLKITSAELHNMRTVSQLIANTVPGRNLVFEEFDGYSKKRYVPLHWKKNNILPEMPAHIPVGKFKGTQLVKQADVLMVLYLFSDQFDKKILKNNYEYYIKRTLHKSSLSPSIHSIIARDAGDMKRAYQFFIASLYIDLHDIYGNTADGMHAACLGGVWQALINGFGGVRLHQENILSIDPRLPSQWNSLKFIVFWCGLPISVSVFDKDIELCYKSNKVSMIKILICGRLRNVFANRVNIFHLKR